MKKALVFAGQGAQYIGMGKDFYEKFDYVKSMYDEASKILGFDVPSICFEDNDQLSQTKYTQPCILVTSIAIYEVLKREIGLNPICVAGFSLGEYSALYASGIFSFQNIITLIKYRAMYMDECANQTKGKMAAVIGLDQITLESICNEVGEVQIANYNSPTQLVISGNSESVDKVMQKIKGIAKRVIPLNVSGAFHTPLMEKAANKIYELVNKMPYNNPTFPIIANYTGKTLDINNLPEIMKKQITSSVQWIKTVEYMIDSFHIDEFVEIGPGKVLSGLIKKIAPNKKTISINNVEDLQSLRRNENEFRK
ncbi:MAG TPA: ACP S-malonyltransferase [Acholeplasmataceae bacterium]|jgi:[acyl-carrier-protein] S-malonyltransferase|nr:ACP S-malonyltransferase [Acholeplasmataceae bacterium]